MSDGKIALVTGGGTGVGKAIAKALLEDGYKVAITGRRREVLDTAAAEWSEHKDCVLAVAADISAPADVERLFAEIIGRFGRLDLLVNNAGMSAPAVHIEDVPFETWNAVVGANLTGLFSAPRRRFAR
ncbi:short-chain dehydrogenase/reductase [Agrobacterium tumefaciens]|nr:short-chain dehydrogenase/reductase [Agrobacterium tumefaciens]